MYNKDSSHHPNPLESFLFIVIFIFLSIRFYYKVRAAKEPHFSLNQPIGPIHSLSRNVRLCVCVCVCVHHRMQFFLCLSFFLLLLLPLPLPPILLLPLLLPLLLLLPLPRSRSSYTIVSPPPNPPLSPRGEW